MGSKRRNPFLVFFFLSNTTGPNLKTRSARATNPLPGFKKQLLLPFPLEPSALHRKFSLKIFERRLLLPFPPELSAIPTRTLCLSQLGCSSSPADIAPAFTPPELYSSLASSSSSSNALFFPSSVTNGSLLQFSGR